MYVRYLYENETYEGYMEGNTVTRLKGSMFDNPGFSDETIPLSKLKLLAPCSPTKVVCVGLNYLDHAQEMNEPLPEAPLLFLKPPTTVIGHEDDIIAPEDTGRLDHEGELAIVIGKRAKNIEPAQADDIIFGYTCANDFTAREIQLSDKQWTRGKSFDTFCPLGPGIVTNINQKNAEISLSVNGKIRQKSNINMFIFGVSHVVSYISKCMTLFPGDVILTGTPHGVGAVENGDVMTVSIDGIGTLTNTLKIV